MACVDEVKKDAARRREKLLLSQRKSRRDAGVLEMHGIQVTARQELDELTAADKKKIVEHLIQHPDVFGYLYEAIFQGAAASPPGGGGGGGRRSPQRSGLPHIH